MTRRGRSARGRTAGLAAALAALCATVGAAVAGASPAAAGGSDAGAVRGVLERLVAEPPPGTLPAGDDTTTWIRTGDAHVRIDPAAVTGLPNGTGVEVRLGPGSPAASVASLRVLSRVDARSTGVSAKVETHSVTVLLALPTGAKADRTTPAAVATAVKGASGYWSRVSGGRFAFSVARTVGWTRLSGRCDDVWGLWDEARRRIGFTPGARRHLLVYVPPGAGCPTGLGTIGDSTVAGGYTVVGGVSVALAAHELGHNLGLGHSDALQCAGASDGLFSNGGWGTRCRHVAYGDWYDVMGISWEELGSLSTAHAYRLGLLGAGSVTTVRTPSRVTLQPVSRSSGLRSLRVEDPAGATYVVEYRPAEGADAWLGTEADWRGLRPGVLVRRVDPGDDTQTLLLDPTPGRTASADPDWNEVLDPGRTLTTASGRVTISVVAAGDSATVAVGVDGAQPTLVVQPAGPLASGAQVTIRDAVSSWAARS